MKSICSKLLEMFYGIDEMLPEEIKIVTEYKPKIAILIKKLKHAEAAKDSGKSDAISNEIDMLNNECAKKCDDVRKEFAKRSLTKSEENT